MSAYVDMFGELRVSLMLLQSPNAQEKAKAMKVVIGQPDNQIHRHDPPVRATTSSQTNSAKRMVLRICTLTFSNFNVRT